MAAAAAAAAAAGIAQAMPLDLQQQQQQQQQQEQQQEQQEQQDQQEQQEQQEQQQQPHQQHQLEHPSPPPPHLAPGPGSVMRDPTINPKLTRLRRACDMCSMRKVKCDDSNVPCKPCRELGVDCTYNRETKRRGPPNKHAEAAKAAKRARLEATANAGFLSILSPQNAAKTLMNISADVMDAETIAPLPVLEHMIDDFFTYIHPLAPFPHEPTFRQSFANREDRTRPEFLGLLASMIAALVASFPRSAREYLRAQQSPFLFPRSSVLVEKCRSVTLLTRGSSWSLKQPKTLDDAATSYFLGLSSGYILQWNSSRYFMAETLTLLRELGFSRPKHSGELPTFGNDQLSPESTPFNHVKDQIGKRIFWCLLLSVRSFSQLGVSHNDVVIAPSTPSLPYPAYPENVDDNYIIANEIIHQPEGTITLLTGFRFAIDIYTTMNGVVSLELAYGMSTLPWADQRLLLRDGLLAAKSIVDNLPLELQLEPAGDGNATAATAAAALAGIDDPSLSYAPSTWPSPQPPHDIRGALKAQPLGKRLLQHEIQRANILVSQLATRSYFVDLYFNLRDVHLAELQGVGVSVGVGVGVGVGDDDDEAHKAAFQDADDKDIFEFMSAEREVIVQNLLTILGSIAQRSLEPSGGLLVSKARQVAATLFNDAPERKGPLAMKSEEALAQLIGVLAKLEKAGPAGDPRAHDPSQMTAHEEDDELQAWAELREFQLRFVTSGGFNGSL
ncbi:hypothetical protein ESCO_006574 [Escovopsis weberi]|uniref:Zn(2)-C6 fungal-type domain-containing protein n=1 Tax=Escovopsis weberi TaxID=150374 RepID=A0A0M8N995_ESCWE|nr:hypothetical protein ESCO_006574 [Escovopsis weberi]